MINPSELAARLPARPLTPDEVDELTNRFDWSVQRIIYTTKSGTEFVPEWYAFRATESRKTPQDDVRGDALCYHMADEMTEWHGEVLREDVLMSAWVQVGERYAREVTGGSGGMTVERVEVEEQVRRLDDPR
jgi:hypothetical protein